MSFSSHAVLEEGWHFAKKSYWHWWPVFIVAVLVPGVLQLLGGALGGWAANMEGVGASLVAALGVIVTILAVLASLLMSLGVFRNAYAVSGGETPSVARLFQRVNFWWFVVAMLVYLAMVTIGLFALVIPGIIVAFMLSLFPYALIAGNANNGFSALATSWDRISSHFWRYMGLRVVLTGVPLAVLIAAVGFLVIIGGGAALGTSAFTGGVAGGVIVAILGVAGLVAFFLLYILAVVYLFTCDALAYRKLAPSWA